FRSAAVPGGPARDLGQATRGPSEHQGTVKQYVRPRRAENRDSPTIRATCILFEALPRLRGRPYALPAVQVMCSPMSSSHGPRGASDGKGDFVTQLVVESNGVSVALDPRRSYRVGRDPGADIVVSVDGVSRSHAVLRFEGGQWILEDSGSANGTYDGGRRVQRVVV